MSLYIDTSTKLANIPITSCFANASGCWCTTNEELGELDRASCGAVVSKSSTLEPRKGNPKPRFCLLDNGTINSMGAPNLGFEFYKDYRCNKPFFQSIIPFSKDELQIMLTSLENDTVRHNVELNLSCPNLVNKSIVAYDYETFDLYLDKVKNMNLQKTTLGIKLPPYYEPGQFDTVSNIIKKYDNIKFVTCINSIVNGLVIDVDSETTAIKPKDGFGGVGGIYCKPTALANVRQFYTRIGDKIDIVGCGGVSNGEDAFEHILCGASAVQVGSALMRKGPNVFQHLNLELMSVMYKKKYKCIDDFKGKLKVATDENIIYNY